jgi:hypothetical protein
VAGHRLICIRSLPVTGLREADQLQLNTILVTVAKADLNRIMHRSQACDSGHKIACT